MFCHKHSNEDPIIDIESPLIEFAWNRLVHPNLFEKLFRKCLYHMEINLDSLAISHDLVRDIDHDEHQGSIKPSTWNRCLFETEFKNLSDQQQKFTFKTERKTTSRYDVSVQRGFKIGGNVNLSIPLKDISGGLTGELHVTKSTGQTFEEVLTWSVDNQVLVESGSGVKAQMMVQEIEMMKDLVVHSTIHAPKGMVLVYVRSRKNRELLKVIRIPNFRLEEIFKSSGIQLVHKNKANNSVTPAAIGDSVPTRDDVPAFDSVETHDNDGTCAHDSLVVACDKGVEGLPNDDACDTICIETKVTMRAIYGAKQFIEIRPFQV